MPTKKPRPIQARSIGLVQAARLAIKDVYDAIVELVTNADDRYQILKSDGLIELETIHGRGKNPNILMVRDFADGMDAATMDKKLSSWGGSESGMDHDEDVRGTHSRGAKDVAALGRVTFESIAADGYYHRCEITPYMEFVPPESCPASRDLRTRIGIPRGTGTLVTIELDHSQTLPQCDKLVDRIERLVALRVILGDERRRVTLRDSGRERPYSFSASSVARIERVKEQLHIPGYPDAKVKLVICRAQERFEREPDRFRLGGILVKSRRAVHQATLFDSKLESDPYALWFCGQLRCEYIDDLCNDFNDRFEKHLPFTDLNPTYPLDPSRTSGLNREHPFVKLLFAEALKRLRPLVEEERMREEHERASIESDATRRRLNALEKAALEFMNEQGDDDDIARDRDGKQRDSSFLSKGFILSPPFAQLVVGNSQLCWLNVRQEAFPEIEVGAIVQIECMSRDISSDKHYCGLEPHPNQEGVLRALWKVKAEHVTPATGVLARVGPILAEGLIEVFESEASRYSDVTRLQFSKKRYTIRADRKGRKIRVLAPTSLVPEDTSFRVECSSQQFTIVGSQVLHVDSKLQVAFADLYVKCRGQETSASLTARLDDNSATAELVSVNPQGAALTIRIEDIDMVNTRYRWNQNVLEIAARHPSIRRYLGRKEDNFPGQDEKHFRLLIAEVVAEAVCQRMVGWYVQAHQEEFQDADWDAYYMLYSRYMTKFLPIAHKLQCPET